MITRRADRAKMRAHARHASRRLGTYKSRPRRRHMIRKILRNRSSQHLVLISHGVITAGDYRDSRPSISRSLVDIQWLM